MNSSNVSQSSGLLSSTVDFIALFSYKQRLIYLPSIIYTCLLIIIGIPGNATVFYIYLYRWRKSSTRIFIITLAVLDLINCTITFPFELATMLIPFEFDNAVSCKIFRFGTYVCNGGGALLLIAIAVDRYQRICKPWSRPMEPSTAQIISIVIVVTSILTCWPSLIIYGTETIVPIPNVLLKMCLIENQYRSTSYPLAYLLIHCSCTLVIFTVLVVIYCIIGTQVCRRWKFRTMSMRSINDEDQALQDISHNDVNELDDVWKDDDKITTDVSSVKDLTPKTKRKQVTSIGKRLLSANSTLQKAKKKALDKRAIRIGKTTIMLFIVTVAYVLCFSPFLILASHRAIYPERWKNMSNGQEMAYHFFLRSYLANCAINPIIYSFFNRIFRKECVKLFRKLFCIQTTFCQH